LLSLSFFLFSCFGSCGQTNQGELSLKAYRLSDAFITLYQNEDFTAAR
jgi:hypothetical protein